MLQRVSSPPIAASIVGTDRTGSDLAISWQRIVAEAKLYWPRHTAKKLSGLTGKSIRTCYRWMADDLAPDAPDIIAIVAAIRAEYAARGKIFEQLSLDLA